MSEGYDTPRADDDLYYERYRDSIDALREIEDEEDETDSPDPEKIEDEE
jgi:hypothetical protein